MEAGTADLILDDVSRNYDPANTLSIYAPNVLPMRQIRIRGALNELANYGMETDASGWNAL